MFNFQLYKESKIYFELFDIYIKEQGISKKELFDSLYISPTSYRRAKSEEQKVGKVIVEQIAEYFQLKTLSEEEIDIIEELSNRIYTNMYYKVYTTYDEDLEQIERLIENRCVLFPVLKVLKLFMLMNSKRSIRDLLIENRSLYNELLKYRVFYTKEVLQVLAMLNLFFNEDSSVEEWTEEYENPMCYQMLASRFRNKKKYIETIYYGNKAKEILEKEFNIKRIITLNITIMNGLIGLGKYQECYGLAEKQFLTLNAFNVQGTEYDSTLKQLVISLLGMKKYEQIIEILEKEESLNLTEIVCLLVALYKKDITQYETKYQEILVTFSKEDRELFVTLDEFLKSNNKKLLFELEKHKIHFGIRNILNKKL